MAEPSADAQPHANLSARLAAYVIDSVALLIVVLAFFVIAGAVLLFSREGNQDPPDSAWNAFMAILIGGPIIFWSALNLTLLTWRAQTPGMYVAGIAASPEEGRARSIRRVLLRWFGLHPVLYHPLLGVIWLLLAAFATSATLSRGVLALTLSFAFLCVIAPLAGLAAMLLDKQRRGLHDRIAATRVVYVDDR